MTHTQPTSARALRRRRSHRPLLEDLEGRALLAMTGVVPDTTLAAPPQLTAQSDTGISNSDGVTSDNGLASAPLTFIIPSVTAGDYYQLYDVTNPASPVPLGGPVLMLLGNTITVSGTTLADGVHQIAYTSATSAGGTQSALSQTDALVIETSLHVLSINPSVNYLTALPSGTVTVTFSGYLAGLVPDQPNSSGFKSNPFAVMLVPSGPEGGAQYAKGAPLWSAPYGVDGGDLPLPATLTYHQNADGTSTITLTPDERLSTDIYLISISGSLTDLAGNALTDAKGNTGPEYSSFDFHATPTNSTPPAVLSVTADNGAIVINNNQIPQPDTIGIAFNEPLDTWSVNTNTVQLLAKQGATGATQVAAAVAYSPTTQTIYLTPEARLTPGTVYYVEVTTGVGNDQAFPALGATLSQAFITSFTVDSAGVGAGSSPLQVLSTNPANGIATSVNLGYGAVTFSEPINLASFGRYSAMLISHTGGATTGSSGYADVPVNAKLAFNPNTNQLVIVPTTGVLPGATIYLFSLSGISAANGDTLGNTPVYSTFLLATPAINAAHPSVAVAPAGNASNAQTIVATTPSSPVADSLVVVTPPRPAQAIENGVGKNGTRIRLERLAVGLRTAR